MYIFMFLAIINHNLFLHQTIITWRHILLRRSNNNMSLWRLLNTTKYKIRLILPWHLNNINKLVRHTLLWRQNNINKLVRHTLLWRRLNNISNRQILLLRLHSNNTIRHMSQWRHINDKTVTQRHPVTIVNQPRIFILMFRSNRKTRNATSKRFEFYFFCW